VVTIILYRRLRKPALRSSSTVDVPLFVALLLAAPYRREFVSGRVVDMGCGASSARVEPQQTLPQPVPVNETAQGGVKVASWNLLCDGLSRAEFMCSGGDAVTKFSVRGPLLAKALSALFESNAVVATQENDHPAWLLHQLRQSRPSIEMCAVPAEAFNSLVDGQALFSVPWPPKAPTSLKIYRQRLVQWLKSHPEHGSVVTSDEPEQQWEQVATFMVQNPDMRAAATGAGLTCTTVSEEHVGLLEDSRKVLQAEGFHYHPSNSHTPHQVWASEEHLVTYYDSSKVRLVAPMHVVHGTAFAASFATVGGSSPAGFEFTVFNAHLPSGERAENEVRRAANIDRLLEAAKQSTNPVILMDSNTGPLYEETFLNEGMQREEFLSSVIERHGFKDVVGSGNECFKMRHAQGGQPKKFGALMYDQIDKIVVPQHTQTHTAAIDSSIFKKLDADKVSQVLQWRKDEELRGMLQNTCISSKWGDKMEVNDLGETAIHPSFQSAKNVLLQLYPNLEAPSDHPPVSAHIYMEKHSPAV